jgi:tRNA(Arg) A34 adenosine deaminase TadA
MIALKETAVAVQNWRLLGVTLYCTLGALPHVCRGDDPGPAAAISLGQKMCALGRMAPSSTCWMKPRFNHRVSITSGVLEAEAADLFAAVLSKA